jgi:hypothetical protein
MVAIVDAFISVFQCQMCHRVRVHNIYIIYSILLYKLSLNILQYTSPFVSSCTPGGREI